MIWSQLLSSNRLSSRKAGTQEPTRSAFEQDYDRIIFSHPFRRLQDKTQVHPLPEHDFVHTRLTHSLEVSSVGRSLGKKVGEVIMERHPELSKGLSSFDFGAITAAASLAHDLGNPPFGHAGEDALSEFFIHHPLGKSFREQVSESQWEDLIKFEGNAQGFRILNKNQYGLKLTYATLGAFTKYPCASLLPGRNKDKKSQKKFGFFQTEAEIFSQVADQLQLHSSAAGVWSRHPLAFLVEAADDICYSIIDLEDGCSLGLIGDDEAQSLFEGVITTNKSKLSKLNQLTGKLERIGYLRALAIGDLMNECAALFLSNEQDILDGKFDKALADHCQSSEGLKEIIKVSVGKIYRTQSVVEIEAAGHEVLPGLMEGFIQAAQELVKPSGSRKYQNLSLLLPPEAQLAITQNPRGTYEMLRQVIDFVSGLTDRHALSLYRKIKGISL